MKLYLSLFFFGENIAKKTLLTSPELQLGHSSMVHVLSMGRSTMGSEPAGPTRRASLCLRGHPLGLWEVHGDHLGPRRRLFGAQLSLEAYG